VLRAVTCHKSNACARGGVCSSAGSVLYKMMSPTQNGVLCSLSEKRFSLPSSLLVKVREESFLSSRDPYLFVLFMPVGHTKIRSNKDVVLSHCPQKFRLSDQLLRLAKPCDVCPCSPPPRRATLSSPPPGPRAAVPPLRRVHHRPQGCRPGGRRPGTPRTAGLAASTHSTGLELWYHLGRLRTWSEHSLLVFSFGTSALSRTHICLAVHSDLKYRL